MNEVNRDGNVPWGAAIPDQQWVVFRAAIAAARDNRIPFALGGAFALAAYSGHWRNTKDIDFYILPSHRDRLVGLLSQAGLKDIHEDRPYDRRWIFRSAVHDVIVDVIWAMANLTAQVDEQWLNRGPEIRVRGVPLRVLPAEELIWAKLYVLQRDRCDWPDVLNVLYATAATLDWRHLLERLGDDLPLLQSVISLFGWLCPGRTLALPDSLRERLPITPAAAGPPNPERVNKLDARPWFAPVMQPSD